MCSCEQSGLMLQQRLIGSLAPVRSASRWTKEVTVRDMAIRIDGWWEFGWKPSAVRLL